MLTFLMIAIPYLLVGIAIARLTISMQWDKATKDHNRETLECRWSFCDNTPAEHVRHKVFAMIPYWGIKLPIMLITGAVDKWVTQTEPIDLKIQRTEKELNRSFDAEQHTTTYIDLIGEEKLGKTRWEGLGEKHFISNNPGPMYIKPQCVICGSELWGCSHGTEYWHQD